jgi:hypothetical protein
MISKKVHVFTINKRKTKENEKKELKSQQNKISKGI